MPVLLGISHWSRKACALKLFFCPYCHDVVKMTFKKRSCECKKCFGFIKDDLNEDCEVGHISELAIPLAMHNGDVAEAYFRFKKKEYSSFIRSWSLDMDKQNVCKVIFIKGRK